MKSIEIIGFKRANLGKAESAQLREDGNVPCVLYGGDSQVHFFSPMYLFRDLVYTQEAKLVELNVDGTVYKAILQDLQIHSVSEVLLHVDFLQIFEDKLVKIEIPIRTSGVSVGVQKGGKLVVKQPKLKVLALPKDLPDFIDVDVTKLDLGKSARVSEVKLTNFTILNPGSLPIVSVAIPRALRGKQTEETAAAGGKKKK
jgi:large subunit ribosomal protein L25